MPSALPLLEVDIGLHVLALPSILLDIGIFTSCPSGPI